MTCVLRSLKQSFSTVAKKKYKLMTMMTLKITFKHPNEFYMKTTDKL